MKLLTLLFAFLLSAHATLARPRQQNTPVPPPPTPADTIFRPVFLTADFAHYAGMAFRLRHAPTGRHYLVTSHSLFGPAADLDVQMSADDIARVIIAAIGISCDHPSVLVTARPYVRLPGARRSDENGSEKDLALFEIQDPAPAPALTLDSAPPVKGDRAWIHIKHPGKTTTGLEAATIAWTTDKELRYLLDNPAADLRGTTGAPVLSATGGVIGINLGTFTAKSGRVYGYACPATSIRRMLEPGWTPSPSPLRSHP